MRTCLFVFCYLDGLDDFGSSRLERLKQFVAYYAGITDYLKYDHIFFSDSGSSNENISDFTEFLKSKNIKNVTFVRHEYISGGKFKHDYPYCWRWLYDFKAPIEAGYDKIIALDSDFYVLSRRFANEINNKTSGWSTVWCPRHNFPEAAFNVLCRDSFPLYEKYTKTPWKARNDGRCMEWDIPYTEVDKSLKCDRFGEPDIAQTLDMDAYAQGRVGRKFIFNP